ncbi:MAG: N-formylglutamate amidohydrolase [Hyphomicrobiales bacterium]|nr:N-formylglutamate amidohydrolase [Hyphomicrobiales bacterium]
MSGALVLCDHASNAIPPELDGLGLPPAQRQRHIAYDIGAAWVSRRLAARLGCPALLSTFSRLLIDPNRGRDDPTLVMRLSDGAIVPGNATLDEAGIAARIARYYEPYDAAIADALVAALAAGCPPAIISVHSFTPVWRGQPRPWHIGLLWDRDDRLTKPLFAALRAEPGLIVGDNEPYAGWLEGDTIDRHATRAGLPNVLIELRQDLIAARVDAEVWADRLAEMLLPILADWRRTMACPLAIAGAGS